VLGASALPARTQARPHRLTWFTLGDRPSADGYVDALRDGLRDLGYQEGRNLALEVHAANFSTDAWERVAAELIALRPAVIVAQGPATRVMVRQPPTVPVVLRGSAHSERSEAWRAAVRAGNAARALRQSEDRERTLHPHPATGPRARRPGDRMKRRAALSAEVIQ
jgi:hypothetical protein